MPIVSGMYYAAYGGGQTVCPPVILIHGAGGNHLTWPPALRRIPGFIIMTIDLPGHGRSNGTGQQAIGSYADTVLRFMDALGLYKAVLVGHSMGGAVALEAAIKEPGRVAGLGMIASGASFNVPFELLELLSNPVTLPNGLDWLQRRLFPPSAPQELVLDTMRILQEARSGVVYGDWLACARFDRREEIARAAARAWIAIGSEDRLTPLACSHFLSTNLPGAALEVVDGAGHMVILEQPARLADSLVTFLNQLSMEQTEPAAG